MDSPRDSGVARVEPPEPHRLACLECRQVAQGNASGWRAYLRADGALAIYCAECAKREFGGNDAD
jgi:hypothetical protein